MSLARRLHSRARPSRDRAEGAEAAPPAATDDGPRATYAAVLDGRHLWLAVDRPGTPGLRDTTTGRVVVSAPTPAGPFEPGRSPAVLALPPPPHPDLEAVLVAPDGLTATPVLGGPTDGGRVPVSPDGRHRWAAGPGDDGILRLVAEEVPQALVLAEVATGAGTLRLRCDPPAPMMVLSAPESGGEPVVAPLPGGTAGDDSDADGWVTVTPADVMALPPGPAAVVAASDHRPVRRRADSLVGPGRGAPLPELLGDDGTPVLQLRWSPEGLLRADVPEPGPAPGAGA